ncbi:cytochrome P450 89A2-like [Triticum dicoccoides]|uniref:cytochrome P450 89A2-like n=1 Tax=Triticum dicoccoides TaxID=85692 RepID=UPI00188F46CD|nr:cytochrome P450 89A2-like [Triticum dicoccoides]
MADLLLLTLLPLALLFLLLHHASPIKALLTRAKSVLAPELSTEINAVVGADAEEVSEVVLGKLEYLHAVIMEALRLHPPTSFAFRQVMEEDHVVHNGQRIPVGTKVYFPLAAIARDRTAWDNPDEFKPQRFLSCKDASQGTDGTIKMMPFGGGRRMCPGRGVATLHLSYFTANLVREFRWREGEGELAVDLQPHVEFFTVMKRPLRAHLELERTEIKTS